MTLTNDEARSLMERYYAGLTDAADERRLTEWAMATADAADDMQADRAVLLAVADDARRRRLAAVIEGLDRPRLGLRRWFAVAATALLLVAVGIGAWSLAERTAGTAAPTFADTCTSPEEAASQLARAVAIVVRQTDKGIAMANDAGAMPTVGSKARRRFSIE